MCSACVGCPKMIQYSLDFDSVSLRRTEEAYWRALHPVDRSCWRRSGFYFILIHLHRHQRNHLNSFHWLIMTGDILQQP